MKKIILICFILTAWFYTSQAQLHFYNYADPNQITTVEEDGSFFWAGTNGGLYKWYESGSGLIGKYDISNGLPSNFVNYIKKDNFYNQLWVCTTNGIAVLNVLSQWTIYNTDNGLPSNVVTSVAIDLSGNKWIATFNGVAMFNPVTNTWVNYSVSDGLAEYHCEAISVDYKGNIWVGTWNGVSVFDGNTWKTYRTTDGLIYNRITSIATDATTGNVWFGSIAGVSKFDGSVFTNYSYTANGLISNSVNSIAVDASGTIWIGTSAGVSRFDGDTTWFPYVSAPGALANDNVLVVFINSEQDIWFGTVSGVSRLSADYATSPTWINYYTGDGIIDNRIDAVTGNSGSGIWISTQNGVSVFDGNYWKSIGANQLASAYVNDIAFDAKGGAYIATKIGLNYSYDSIMLTFNKDSGLISNKVTAVAVDKSGNVWCGTDSGVSIYNGSKWQSFNVGSELNNNYINYIAVDSQNVKWFATSSGVSSYDGTSWKKYSVSSGLIDSNVFVIGIDTSGNKWFGTDSGLSVFNGTKWVNYSTANGLSNNSIQAIAFDKEGNPWIGTSYGLSYFNGKVWVSYTDSDGLASSDITGIFVSSNDTKWIGTIGGLSKGTCMAPVVNFTADTACLPGITSFANTSTVVNNGTQYSWTIYANDTLKYFTKNITHQFTIPGIFKAILTASNMTCSSSDTNKFAVRLKPVVSIEPLGSTTICNKSSVSIQASISNSYEGAAYHYKWSDGDTLPIASADSSKTYFLHVKDGNCVSNSDTITVTVRYPFNFDTICLVTFDNTTGYNLVTWERTPDVGIASYNVYKILGNTYSLIGNVNFNDLSIFEDVTSQPSVTSDRYSITAVDTCGNESGYSSYHQTINLGSSVGTIPGSAVLNWNFYVDQSGVFVPDWYYIYKGNTPDNMSLLDSVSGFVNLYNDSVGGNYYFVGVKKSPACNPAELKINEGPYSEAVSNLEDNRMKADTNQNLNEHLISSFSILPNPFSTNATVYFNLLRSSNVTFAIYSTLGNEIGEQNEGFFLPGNQQFTINSEGLNNGMYLLKLITDSDSKVGKIMVNK